jgi:hypothetical protein
MPLLRAPINPNTAWLRELTVSDLFVFLVKLGAAGLLIGIIVGAIALAVRSIMGN